MSKNTFTFLVSLFVLLGTNAVVEAQSWGKQTNPTNGTANVLSGGKIQFVSSSEGWISTSAGKLLHTTDAGTNWSVVAPFPSDTVWSFSDPAVTMSWVDQTHGWKINGSGTGLGSCHGAVLHFTTDGGNTWEKKVMSNMPGDVGLEVQFLDDNTGWALIYNPMTGAGLFQKSTDGGNNWTTITHDTVGIFCFVDALNGWSIMNNASKDSSMWINHTTDGGVHWGTQYTDKSAGSFNAIQFTDPNDGWVVGGDGKILKTTDGGTNWVKVTNAGIAPQSESKCLFFLNADTGWIGTNDGIPDQNPDRVLLQTTDGGLDWTTSYRSQNDSSAIFSIYFRDASNGWFIGDYGLIEHQGTGTGVEIAGNNSPADFSLDQNYPNPFNPATRIGYDVSNTSYVTVVVYDILGRKMETLVNAQQRPGHHEVAFDGSKLSSGVYFYRLAAGSNVITRKMILMK